MSICGPGLTFVALNGGVFLSGHEGWAIDPGNIPITDITCDAFGVFYALTRDSRLLSIANGLINPKYRTLASLPKGDYRIRSTVDGLVWIWGVDASRRWLLYSFADKGGLKLVWRGTDEISALSPAGRDSVLVAHQRTILLHRKHMPPLLLFKAQGKIDGLAADPKGNLYYSMQNGIMRIANKGKSQTVVAKGIHGPLLVKNDLLMCLWRERAAVVALTANPPQK